MKKISIGGQALIEGIMMKSPEKTAMAVRTPDRSIDIEYIEEKHIKDKLPFLGWPILRGVVNFVESMILGYKTLMMSADKSGMTDLEEEEELEKKRIKAEKKRQKLIAKGKITPEEAEKEKTEEETASKEDEKGSSALITVVSCKGKTLIIILNLNYNVSHKLRYSRHKVAYPFF